MVEGPFILLSKASGQTCIETGLVVIRESRNRLFSKREDWADRELLNNIAIHHEWVHFLQSITSASIYYTAREICSLSETIVTSAAKGEVPNSFHYKFRQITESLYGRRAEESFRFEDIEDGFIFIPISPSDQIGVLDLMEGVAVLESFKLCTMDVQVDDFLWFRDRYFPGSEKSTYRRTFDWFAKTVGPQAAYELLGPVSFLALQSNDPPAEFVSISSKLSQEKNLDCQELKNIRVLTDLAYPGGWKSSLQRYENSGLGKTHLTLDPCIAFAKSQLGLEEVMQLGAVPSQVTQETYAALRPPVIAYSGMDSAIYESTPYAREQDLDNVILNWTSIVGAAERLTILAEKEVYQFCPHRIECPHSESALCHKNFAAPALAKTFDQCRFPQLLSQVSGLEPDALWAIVGRQRKSVQELLREFDDTGEVGLWALARRQRASIIAWLGKEGYEQIEWKCKLVADKTMHALQTQKVQDFAEARWYRDAVVNEIRKLALDRNERNERLDLDQK